MPTKQACRGRGPVRADVHLRPAVYASTTTPWPRSCSPAWTLSTTERRQNFQNTLSRLLELDALPIINENDTVATDEITAIGDNDTLAAIVAAAPRPICWCCSATSTACIPPTPTTTRTPRLIPRGGGDHAGRSMALADGASGSAAGHRRHGRPKLRAAQMVTAERGRDMVIANGAHPELLYDIAEGKPAGTRFLRTGRRAMTHDDTGDSRSRPSAAKQAVALASCRTRKTRPAAPWQTRSAPRTAWKPFWPPTRRTWPPPRAHLRRDAGPPGSDAGAHRVPWRRASGRWPPCPTRWAQVLNRVERPNGLVIEKTAVPMGVIAIIYESRPNVTSDAAALALKSGNACVLRGGKEACRSAPAPSSPPCAGACGRPACPRPPSIWWRTPPAPAPTS